MDPVSTRLLVIAGVVLAFAIGFCVFGVFAAQAEDGPEED